MQQIQCLLDSNGFRLNWQQATKTVWAAAGLVCIFPALSPEEWDWLSCFVLTGTAPSWVLAQRKKALCGGYLHYLGYGGDTIKCSKPAAGRLIS